MLARTCPFSLNIVDFWRFYFRTSTKFFVLHLRLYFVSFSRILEVIIKILTNIYRDSQFFEPKYSAVIPKLQSWKSKVRIKNFVTENFRFLGRNFQTFSTSNIFLALFGKKYRLFWCNHHFKGCEGVNSVYIKMWNISAKEPAIIYISP